MPRDNYVPQFKDGDWVRCISMRRKSIFQVVGDEYADWVMEYSSVGMSSHWFGNVDMFDSFGTARRRKKYFVDVRKKNGIVITLESCFVERTINSALAQPAKPSYLAECFSEISNVLVRTPLKFLRTLIRVLFSIIFLHEINGQPIYTVTPENLRRSARIKQATYAGMGVAFGILISYLWTKSPH